MTGNATDNNRGALLDLQPHAWVVGTLMEWMTFRKVLVDSSVSMHAPLSISSCVCISRIQHLDTCRATCACFWSTD